MNLKNYTSEVSASRSMALIEEYLVKAGATDISKKYADGVCSSVVFRMVVNGNALFFQLPAKVQACFDVFWRDRVKKTKQDREYVLAQSQRTAWKILHDWVQIQLSMIQLEQVEAIQVFLSYVYDPVSEQTFYEKLKGSGFKALLPSSK